MSHSVSQSSDDPFELCGVGADEGPEGDFADADRLHGHRARLGLHHLLNLSKLKYFNKYCASSNFIEIEADLHFWIDERLRTLPEEFVVGHGEELRLAETHFLGVLDLPCQDLVQICLKRR